MKRILTLSVILFLLAGSVANAQTTYRSVVASGNWQTAGTWETSTDLVTWVPAGGTPSASNDVIIKAGTTVILDASGKNCKNLTIQAGGTFKALAAAAEKTMRINGSLLQNDGTLGVVNEQMGIELLNTNLTGGFTITGSGTSLINRIRMNTGNVNSAVNTVIVDQNMTSYVGSNGIGTSYAFSAAVAPGTVTDNYVLTLNSGKTYIVTGGTWHSGTSGGVPPAGSYTYNINGTLDMSGSTTTSSNTFAGSAADASKALTVNINGTVKLPTSGLSTLSFGETAAAGQLGSVIFNISGLLDCSIAPINNTTTTIAPRLFNLTPTGFVRRTVGGSATSFPVSAGGSNNTASITNAGTSDDFSVNVKTTLDNAAPDANKIVNRQWTINELVPGGTVGTISLSWQSANQAAGFNPGQTVAILRWTGSAWEPHTATITGTGSAADPYVATASGFVAFSPFIVANFTAVPIAFSNATAFTKKSGVQVDWKISNDINTSKFEVERSLNGSSFTSLSVVPVVVSGSYGYFDATPAAGANYYRIKSIDRDGNVKYSTIMKVNISTGKPSINIAPNPISGTRINLQMTNIDRGTYTVEVFSNSGQKVFSSKINSDGGSSTQSLDLPATLRKGTYNLQMNNGSLKFNKTVVFE